MSADDAVSAIAGGDSLQKIKRKSLAESIADELRDLVLLEKLKPGTTIPERETADALGVSRTPLRESLRILASEGLVEIEPNRAPVVANPSIDELKSLLQVQGAIEGLGGELACAAATDDELKQIELMERDMRAVSDSCEPLEFFQKDMKFHASIVAASHNLPLIETHKNYNSRLWRARFISSRRRVNRSGTLEQHQQIVEALLARQRKKCSKALSNHLQMGFRNIKTALSEAGHKADDIQQPVRE